MSDDPEDLKSHYNERAAEYDEMYFGDSEDYPSPLIARDIVLDRLTSRSVTSVLDAGCGNGGVLVSMLEEGFDAYGFDIAPKLVGKAKSKIEDRGFDPDRVRQANMEQGVPFDGSFDAVIGLGILPQLSDIGRGFERIASVVETDGTVLLQFRNSLMSLYSFNEYTYEFIQNELLKDLSLSPDLNEDVEERLRQAFKLNAETPGRSPEDDPEGSFHNPLTIEDRFEDHGFLVEDLHFYHYHALPPEFEHSHPEAFKNASLAIERPSDWRGYVMASAFIVEAVPSRV